MAYAHKQTVDDLYQLIDEGWTPTFSQTKEKYYSNKNRRKGNQLDTATQEKLTRLLIMRVRNKFKKEEKPRYFYEVDGSYKLLESSSDSLSVTKKLVGLTGGFQKASNEVIKDTAEKYPQLTAKFLYKIQASFEQIDILANIAINSLEEGIKEHESTDEQD